MKWFIKKLIKKNNNSKSKSKSKLNHISDCSETETTPILVLGKCSVALGVRDFPIPTGICGNPISVELKEYIKQDKQDKLGQLLRNPIYHCAFYNNSTGYCFFAGFCNEKHEISKSLVEHYKHSMRIKINEQYGEK